MTDCTQKRKEAKAQQTETQVEDPLCQPVSMLELSASGIQKPIWMLQVLLCTVHYSRNVRSKHLLPGHVFIFC